MGGSGTNGGRFDGGYGVEYILEIFVATVYVLTRDERVGDFKADELYCAVKSVMHGIRFNDSRRTGLRRHQN